MLSNTTSLDVQVAKSAMTETAETLVPASVSETTPLSTSTRSTALPTDEMFDWKKMDSLRFVVQVGFSLIVLSLCIGKLTLPNQNDHDQALYWGGITGLLAWWMPSPGNSKTVFKSDAK